MADIISGKFRFAGNRNADAPKQKNIPLKEHDEAEIENRIKKHRLKRLGIIAAIILALVVIIIVAVVLFDGITYSSYTVVNSVNRDDSMSTQYVTYADGYIRYSNDGASYYNKKGNALWNQTYSMQKPQIKMCGDAVAIGDINGSKIYVFNKAGSAGIIDTSLTISQIEVAKQGVVAAVLEDNDANYINLYDSAGTKIYSVKTSLSGDGYPLDISISEDATKLMASYLYVSGETMKTNVVFYNFSEVGQNETERVVGGFNHYDSTIVGDVRFINETVAVAVGEDVLSIYTIKEYPKLSKEIKIDNEVQRVFFSDSNIGLVLDNSNSKDIYKLEVYNLSGKLVCDTTFSTQYDDISFDGDSIIMYNSNSIVLMNLKGKKLCDITMDMPVNYVLSEGSRGNYIVINSKYVQSVRFK